MSFIGLGLGLSNSLVSGGEPTPLTAPDLSGFTFVIPDVLQGTEIIIPILNSGGPASLSVNNLLGATFSNQNLIYTADTLGAFNNVSVTATNAVDSDTSNTDSFNVYEQLSITTQLNSPTVTEGETATFTISVAGATAYQLEVNDGDGWESVPGGTSNPSTSSPMALSQDGEQYRMRVFGAVGQEIVSNVVTLTVNEISGSQINQSAFRDAVNDPVTVNEDATFDFDVLFEQTTGPAPFLVNFQIHDPTGLGLAGVTAPIHEVQYISEYGDPTSTSESIPVDHPFGNGLNLSMGGHGTHVYETPGTYTIKIYGRVNATGGRSFKEYTVTVTDPDIIYAGTKTVVWSPTADYANAPSGAYQAATLSEAINRAEGAGEHRLMIQANTAETAYQMPHDMVMNNDGSRLITTYDGDKAYFEADANILTSNRMFYLNSSNIVMKGIVGVGDYDPVDGVGETYKTKFADLLADSAAEPVSNILLYRCGWRGLNGNTFQASGLSIDHVNTRNWGVVDCEGWNSYDNDVLASAARSAGIVGNKFTRDSSSVSGDGGKKVLATVGGSVAVANPTLTYTMDRLLLKGNGTSVLRAFLRNTATNELTRLVETTDFTFTEGVDAVESNTTLVTPGTHQLTFVNAIPAGSYELYYYYRREGDHGPARVAQTYGGWLFEMNYTNSYYGWSSSGLAIQPCFRINSSVGTGSLSYTNRNYCLGGITQISIATESEGSQGKLQDAIVEANYCVADSSSYCSISAALGGTNVRNNVALRGVFGHALSEKYYKMVEHLVNSNATQESIDNPQRIFNNTLINLNDQANDVVDSVVAGPRFGSNQATTVLTGNNLLYAPNQTAADISNAPIDLNNYGALLSGSPALNGGTATPYVGDDFFGKSRVISNNSIGATQFIHTAVPVPVSVIGTLALADATVGDSVTIDLTTIFSNAETYGVEGGFPSGYSIDNAADEITITYDADGTFTDYRLSATANGVTVYSNLDTVVISPAVVLTNKLVNATNTDNGSWGGKQCTPNGTLMTDNAISDQHYRSQSVAAPGAGNTERLVYEAKFGTHKHMGTRLNPGGSYQNVIFDIENGTLVSMAAGFDSASITDIGGGWYRLEVEVTNRTMGEIRISMFDAAGTAHSYSGSSTSSDARNIALYDI